MWRSILVVLFLVPSSCGSSASSPSTSVVDMMPTTQPDLDRAPTYTELFAMFFAPGTPGHCATPGCHADPGHHVWVCGTTKDTCYAGMVDIGLIDPTAPTASQIGDPSRSPLTWINPTGGNMPFDAPAPNPAGRDAIRMWVAAGAQNN
jgi:hypothetical protein